MSPRKIADILIENIDLAGTYFVRCEAAGPGFLNFYLGDAYYADVLKDIESLGDAYGRSTSAAVKR